MMITIVRSVSYFILLDTPFEVSISEAAHERVIELSGKRRRENNDPPRV
jgi:hypothetical protein